MNRLAAVGSIALVAGLTATAGADVLVTRDGASVETKGSWSVEGRQVIFTLPNGTLSSLRTDEVDLDRSAVATARIAERAAAAAVPTAAAVALPPLSPLPPPRFRITDKDLESATPVAEDTPEGGDGDEGGSADPSTSTSDGPLEVISWDRIELADGDGVEIFGTIRNNGSVMVAAPNLSLFVYGERGGLLATSDGTVNLASIPPGKTANFRAPLPGLHDFAAIKFDLGGRGAPTGGTEAADGGEPSDEEVDVDPGAQYDEMAENLYQESAEEPAESERTEDGRFEEEPLDEEPPLLD